VLRRIRHVFDRRLPSPRITGDSNAGHFGDLPSMLTAFSICAARMLLGKRWQLDRDHGSNPFHGGWRAAAFVPGEA
jgi:hypothetical protein